MISARVALIAGCAVYSLSVAAAGDEPDMDFLDYLGMWEETDEDWQLVAEITDDEAVAENEKRSDPVPQGEESQESEDDS